MYIISEWPGTFFLNFHRCCKTSSPRCVPCVMSLVSSWGAWHLKNCQKSWFFDHGCLINVNCSYWTIFLGISNHLKALCSPYFSFHDAQFWRLRALKLGSKRQKTGFLFIKHKHPNIIDWNLQTLMNAWCWRSGINFVIRSWLRAPCRTYNSCKKHVFPHDHFTNVNFICLWTCMVVLIHFEALCFHDFFHHDQ